MIPVSSVRRKTPNARGGLPQEDDRFSLTLYNPVLHSVILRARPNPMRQFVSVLLPEKGRCCGG
jgi:hypothetical protein